MTAHTIGTVNTIANIGPIAGIDNSNIVIVGIVIVGIANTDVVIIASFFVGIVSNVIVPNNITNIVSLQRLTSTSPQQTPLRLLLSRIRTRTQKLHNNKHTAGATQLAVFSVSFSQPSRHLS